MAPPFIRSAALATALAAALACAGAQTTPSPRTIAGPSSKWSSGTCAEKEEIPAASCSDLDGFVVEKDFIHPPESSDEHTMCFIATKYFGGIQGWGTRVSHTGDEGAPTGSSKDRKCGMATLYYHCKEPAVVRFEAVVSEGSFDPAKVGQRSESDSVFVVHDNRGVDVRVFTKIDLERWEFTRSLEDRQSKVEWYTSRPARTHTVFDDKVHSITFLERDDGTRIKSVKIVTLGGQQCVFGVPAVTTTVQPAVTSNQAMTEIESLKKQVKDLQDTMDGKLAAIDKQIKATDRAQVVAAEISATIGVRVGNLEDDAEAMGARVGNLEDAITAAVKDAAGMLGDMGPKTCGTAEECTPAIERDGNDLTIAAPTGNAFVSTKACGNVDLCGLATALNQIIAGLANE